MKIKANQLQGLLNKQLYPVYIISGDEPFQREDACFLIRTSSKKAGVYERLVYHADTQFDWSLLEEAASSLSLFAERRLIELRLPSENKLTKAAETALLFYAKNIPLENILIIVCNKINKAISQSAWFKKLESLGVWISVWPIEGKPLIRWITERAHLCGLKITPEASVLLAERTEGNLLAAAQETEKLRLLTNDNKITLQQVSSLVSDSAHYDIFGLIDAILAADTRHAVRMYRRLCEEGVELSKILGVIVRELRMLAQLAFLLTQNFKLDAAIEKIAEEQNISLFILRKKRHQHLGCINRLGEEKICQLLVNASDIDSTVKKGTEKHLSYKLLSLILQASGVLKFDML